MAQVRCSPPRPRPPYSSWAFVLTDLLHRQSSRRTSHTYASSSSRRIRPTPRPPKREPPNPKSPVSSLSLLGNPAGYASTRPRKTSTAPFPSARHGTSTICRQSSPTPAPAPPLTPVRGLATRASASPWASLITGRHRRIGRKSSSSLVSSRSLGNTRVAGSPCYPISTPANSSRSSAALPGELVPPNLLPRPGPLPLPLDHPCRRRLVAPPFLVLPPVLCPFLGSMAAAAPAPSTPPEHRREAPCLPMEAHHPPV